MCIWVEVSNKYSRYWVKPKIIIIKEHQQHSWKGQQSIIIRNKSRLHSLFALSAMQVSHYSHSFDVLDLGDDEFVSQCSLRPPPPSPHWRSNLGFIYTFWRLFIDQHFYLHSHCTAYTMWTCEHVNNVYWESKILHKDICTPLRAEIQLTFIGSNVLQITY